MTIDRSGNITYTHLSQTAENPALPSLVGLHLNSGPVIGPTSAVLHLSYHVGDSVLIRENDGQHREIVGARRRPREVLGVAVNTRTDMVVGVKNLEVLYTEPYRHQHKSTTAVIHPPPPTSHTALATPIDPLYHMFHI